MRKALLATLLLAAAGLSPAAVIFSDDFSGEPGYVLNYTGFANFDVTQGTVDAIGCGSTGNCVDLDGSATGLGAVFQTKTAFNLLAGRTYTLSFQFDGGSQIDDLTVSVGNVYTNALGTGYNLNQTYNFEFTTPTDTTGKIVFTNNSVPNFVGPYLTSVSLSESVAASAVPEPATVGISAFGLAIAAAVRRRVAKR